MSKNYDFSGWATKNNILCSDGRTIRQGAFAEQDGATVPLVWNHRHDDPTDVLGHAVLENREDGVYAYCTLNDTEAGQTTKQLVHSGDVKALSIYANKLKQKGGDVIHGVIREVSVVLAGANKGAIIDSVLEHGDESPDEAEIMFIGYGDVLSHSDEEENEMQKKDMTLSHADDEESEETVQDVYNSMTDKQKKAVDMIVAMVLEDQGKGGDDADTEEAVKHADDSDEEESGDDETIEDVINSMSEKQQKVLQFLVGKAVEDNSNGGNEDMKHNVFDRDSRNDEMALSHSDMQELLRNAKREGSLKAAIEESVESGVLAHADYGIEDIEYLFPDAKTLNPTPEFIQRDTSWVEKVVGGAHHTPFSRVKSMFANITEDEARAKGYIKGNLKKEEVFSLLKRTTDPQTIYKKQKLDKDDIDDITDFSVVAWIKAEMQMMLREEIARAILIGDGRLSSDDDKIREDHIRPIYNDSALFTVKAPVKVSDGYSDVIDDIVRARQFYKGSGNPTFFTTENVLTEMLLLKNGYGERLFKSEAELATALRVKEIVTVEAMESIENCVGIVVNMADYNIGTNGGAKTDFFDDFDIDYNQYKYLYETRMSGALIKPFSALYIYNDATAGGTDNATRDEYRKGAIAGKTATTKGVTED